ncbi:DUF1885 family protein [Sutcliffiella rhizosphaerae]|uniref:DUF1885 family protein n=1 Tax=Sutcliffiella rhizosphaerae TaxID=2880967 RepID=A0ABM8YJ31_9BACI|nr:DUF1885 family protein [Sutcliffiella rhizosphaerae]CAG9619875.1 hypothetical protein BACCIP111883_00643 [Sutcliffiella rhizosphaerae]
MASSAYINLMEKSKQKTITLEGVKELLHYYKDITSKTGKQLGWEYSQAAFPYEIKEKPEGKGVWFYLKGTEDRYRMILIGVGTQDTNSSEDEPPLSYIQVTLHDQSTHGDKGKANELCKFLAKKLDAQLTLFTGSIMYYYKR